MTFSRAVRYVLLPLICCFARLWGHARLEPYTYYRRGERHVTYSVSEVVSQHGTFLAPVTSARRFLKSICCADGSSFIGGRRFSLQPADRDRQNS